MSESKNAGDIAILKGAAQLDLFGIVDRPEEQRRDSHTFELYDALPKYSWASQREYADLDDAPALVRRCTVANQSLQVVVYPAQIPKNGRSVLIYPGQREELIEDALRKLATGGQASLINGMVGVTFTLYQLQQELKSMGHSYNLDEIKEAIFVCGGSKLECVADNGASKLSTTFFPTVGLTSKGEWSALGKAAKCFVHFHPWVTEGIRNLSFRRYDYTLQMQISSPLARFLYKRMCHFYGHASPAAPFSMHLKSFLEQSPRGLSARMSENIRAMKNALEALQQHSVVSMYHEEKLQEGRSVSDVEYTVHPHENFVAMVRRANAEQQARENVLLSAEANA